MARNELRPTRNPTRLLAAMATALLVSGFALVAGAQSTADPDYVAIVHPSNEVETLSPGDLRDLLLADQKKWNRTSSVHPILPEAKSATMAYLLKHVLRMNSESDLSMYFMAAVFQQKISGPPSSGSQRTVIAAVAKDPGAVSFVPRSAVSGLRSIRIVEITGL